MEGYERKRNLTEEAINPKSLAVVRPCQETERRVRHRCVTVRGSLQGNLKTFAFSDKSEICLSTVRREIFGTTLELA